MGVSADNRREPDGDGIEIQRIAVVQHVEGVTMQRNHFRGGQVGARPVGIDVSADRGNRSEFAE